MNSLVKEQKLYRVDHYGERDQEQEITNSNKKVHIFQRWHELTMHSLQ